MAVKGSTYIMSEAQKKAISEARRGYVTSLETRQKISQSLKGHPVSDQTRELISRGMMGNENGSHNHLKMAVNTTTR